MTKSSIFIFIEVVILHEESNISNHWGSVGNLQTAAWVTRGFNSYFQSLRGEGKGQAAPVVVLRMRSRHTAPAGACLEDDDEILIPPIHGKNFFFISGCLGKAFYICEEQTIFWAS